jgi:hypothetical protein
MADDFPQTQPTGDVEAEAGTQETMTVEEQRPWTVRHYAAAFFMAAVLIFFVGAGSAASQQGQVT